MTNEEVDGTVDGKNLNLNLKQFIINLIIK